MKFTTNTRPLAEALNLGIIDSNVSNFYKKSGITQISATTDKLKINIESSMICTEITVNGVGEGEPATAFVDSLLFKKLVNTLEANVTIEFDNNGIKLQSGTSKFSLGNNIGDAIDVSDFSLKTPSASNSAAEFSDINKQDWQFIKNNQMYAISSSYVRPVYTKVWIGEDGDVLTGDFDISRFTHSKKGNLGTTCLLSDTIINLFNSLPDIAKIAKVGDDYIVKFSKDAYDYVTQFTPQYESDENIGSYKSDMFLSKMTHPTESSKVFTKLVTKLLNQATLLSTVGSSSIKFSVSDGTLNISDDNVNGKFEVDGGESLNYSVNFRLDLLKQVIANYGDEQFVDISPVFANDGSRAIGIIIWNDNLTTILAGVE